MYPFMRTVLFRRFVKFLVAAFFFFSVPHMELAAGAVAELIVGSVYAEEDTSVAASAAIGAGPATSVSQFTGAASISIPIQAAPGRMNMAPNIALTYSSHQGNGWIGTGFSLDMGSIQRSAKHGLDYNANGNGAFVAAINGASGDLVRRTDWDQYCSSGVAYGTRVDNSLSRYCFNGQYWQVTAKDGSVYLYGSLSDGSSRQDFANGTKVFKWYLDKVTDINGNTMKISYWKDTNQYGQLIVIQSTDTTAHEVYLSRIDYTGNDSLSLVPTSYVEFALEDRNERRDYTCWPPTSYCSGGCIPTGQIVPPMFYANYFTQMGKRLKTIRVFSNNTLQRKYDLTYEYSPSTDRSRLVSLVQSGSDSNTTLTTSFDWNDEGEVGRYTSYSGDTPLLPDNDFIPNPVKPKNRKWFSGDVNGDGRSDFMAVMKVDANGFANYPHTGFFTAISNADHTFTYYPVQETLYAWDENHVWFSGDVNGDGKTDFMGAIKTDDGFTMLVTGVSNGNGTYLLPDGLKTAIAWQDKRNQLWFSGDINGDGKTDFMGAYRTGTKFDSHTVLATSESGSGTYRTMEISAPWTVQVTKEGQVVPSVNWFSGDVNGDGKAEFMGYGPYGNWILSTSDDLMLDPDYKLPATAIHTAIPNNSSSYNQVKPGLAWPAILFPGDVNGDGRTDFLGFSLMRGEDGNPLTTGWAVSLRSTGLTGADAFAGLRAGPAVVPWTEAVLAFPGDVNGDGRTDLMMVETMNADGLQNFTTLFSNGNGQFVKVFHGDDEGIRMGTKWFPGDAGGDGKTGFMGVVKNDSTGYIQLRVNMSTTPMDLITSTTNPIGGTTGFWYTPSSAYANTYMPFVLQTLSAISKGDGRGGSMVAKYMYQGGKYDAVEREFLGFSKVVSYQMRDESAYESKTESTFLQDFTTKGLMSSQVVTGRCEDSSSPCRQHTKTIANFYNVGTLSGGVTYPRLDYTVTTIADAGAVPYSFSVFNQYDPTYLHAVSERKYGFAISPGSGTNPPTPPSGYDTLTEYTDFTTITSQGMFPKPGTVTVKDTNGGILSRKWMEYDGQARLIAEEVCKSDTPGTGCSAKNSSQNPRVGYAYYPGDGGNLSATTAANGCTTTTIYDGTKTFAVSSSNCLNQVAAKEYYPSYPGRVWKVIPPHLRNTGYYGVMYEYDALGRVTKETRADGGYTAYVYSSLGQPAGERQYVQKTEHIVNGATVIDHVSWSYFDGLGRGYLTTSTGPVDPGTGLNKTIVSYTAYDQLGRPARKSRPYFSGDTPRETVFHYDGLSRVIATELPDGNFTQTQYLGLARKTQDSKQTQKGAAGLWSTATYDIYQRLKTSTDLLNTTTTYNYDPLGNLLRVSRPKPGSGTIITTMTYDSTGKKRTMQDPDMGAWSYVYDRSGNLISQTDAKSQTITFDYDLLNRTLHKYYSDHTVTFTYDTAPSGSTITCPANVPNCATGIQTQALDPSGGENKIDQTLVLDIMQRATKSAKTTGVKTATIAKTYDSAGRVYTITYFPDDQVKKKVFSYTYDVAGNLLNIGDTTNGSTVVQYSGFTAMNQPGKALFPKAQKNIETVYSYEPAMGRLSNLKTTQAGPAQTITSWACPVNGASYATQAACTSGCAETASCNASQWKCSSSGILYTKGATCTAACTQTVNCTTPTAYQRVSTGTPGGWFMTPREAETTTVTGSGGAVLYHFPGGGGHAFSTTGAAFTGSATCAFPVKASGNKLLFGPSGSCGSISFTGVSIGGEMKINTQYIKGDVRTMVIQSIPQPTVGDWLRVICKVKTCDANGTCTNEDKMCGGLGFGPASQNICPLTGGSACSNASPSTCTGPAACSISGYSCPLTGGSACSTGSSPACSRNVACTQSTVTVPPVLQDLTYEYDENGNIEKVSDKVNYLVHNYAYDDLNRLKQAVGTGTGAYTQSYDYDILGNIIYKSDVGTYAYSYGDKPHALRSAGSMTFAYDANGNMTTRQGVSITWNADNKPVSVGSTTFAYDGMGNRVKKTSTSGTTYYFGEAYEIRGSVGVIHLFANGQRIATIRDDGRSFTTHGNHLGSASVVTDQNGEAKEKMEYFPFGAYRANASPNDQYGTKDFDGTFPNANYTFTGQELDETGLYDYHARQYDPVTGRFISPDSVIQSPGDLQTFNRYSYVRNNPLVYTDPSGHWLDIVFGAVMGGVSAGYETNWDFDAVLVGCVAGALSSWAGGYVGGYMGSVVYSATESQFVGAVAGVAVGGAVGGAVSGGIWAGAYGNDIGGAMATGAINGAVSALVQYGARLGMGQIGEWMSGAQEVCISGPEAAARRYEELGLGVELASSSIGAKNGNCNGHWVYSESSGQLSFVDDSSGTATKIGAGYSGHDEGLNNPGKGNVQGIGPIPTGYYKIGPMQTNVTNSGHTLTNSMRLTPLPETEMWGRAGFLIHGGNFSTMGSSQGCIVLPLGTRQLIGSSGCNILIVTY